MEKMKVGNRMLEKRGSYVKKDKDVNKLVKKARESDVRREKIDQKHDKLLREKYEYDAKDKRKLKMLSKKHDEDTKREARRDERHMGKK